MTTIAISEARRLALARAGLLKPEWTGMPERARGGTRARAAAHAVIDRFGYLQLDTVSVAGARSHAIVLLSRIAGFDPTLGEELLVPGAPLFEYWGHEASWMPLRLYPAFAFRRHEFRSHPWFGDVLGTYPELARQLLDRIAREGPLRSADLASPTKDWWDLKPLKKVALALWSCGELAIAQRHNFQRTFDLSERVIPATLRETSMDTDEALRSLLLLALAGHGWATASTLAATWRLRKRGPAVRKALCQLEELGQVRRCTLTGVEGKRVTGWITPEDRELAARLRRVRPRPDRGVLLSPFDPVLWDRARVLQLFDFEQVLEIYKPAAQRRWGYFCMPVLAGDRLVARVDLKCDRSAGRLVANALHFETDPPSTADREALRTAISRYAAALSVDPASTGGV